MGILLFTWKAVGALKKMERKYAIDKNDASKLRIAKYNQTNNESSKARYFEIKR